MSNEWVTTQVCMKFMLSDFILYKRCMTLKVFSFSVISEFNEPGEISKPSVSLEAEEKGYFIRSIPLPAIQPTYRIDDGYIFYIPDQFSRYYIDLQQSFADYSAKFSSKTRSTIRRKIKKFSTQCNGEMHWKRYQTVDEILDFYQHAREVSQKSYQERLLDAGLPDTGEFKQSMVALASNGLVRGYLLFDGETPVAYMYCPIQDKTLLYQYLGYDQDYNKWSVGTILHWYVFEDIFEEGGFKYFDFTEGQSEHKLLYSTGSVLCGNVYILPKSMRNTILTKSHGMINSISVMLGEFLDRFHLKAKIKRLIRFGRVK